MAVKRRKRTSSSASSERSRQEDAELSTAQWAMWAQMAQMYGCAYYSLSQQHQQLQDALTLERSAHAAEKERMQRVINSLRGIAPHGIRYRRPDLRDCLPSI